MDRALKPAHRREFGPLTLLLQRRHAPMVGWAVLTLVVAATWRFWSEAGGTVWTGGHSLMVAQAELEVAVVRTGSFDDYVAMRGQVEPLRTIYLDAVEGGRVEKILAEEGQVVQAGQLLLELSNPSLALDVIARETQVSTQLTQARSAELSLEQDHLNRANNRALIEFRLQRLRRQQINNQGLLATGAITDNEANEVLEDLVYHEKLWALAKSTDLRRDKLAHQQEALLRDAYASLHRSLQLARRSLDHLAIRAPVAARLTSFDVEIGQNVVRGSRVAQLDVPDAYKIKAAVDEFYLARVALDQAAFLVKGEERYELVVKKIDPQVRNGTFDVELKFVALAPAALKRGQTVDLRLYTDGAPASGGVQAPTLLLKNGAFYQESGGHWVFVVDEDGKLARRRPVTLGRKNARELEVISGVKAGERVIVSSYSGYADKDVLIVAEGPTP